TLAIFRTVGVAQHIKFADRIDTQQLLTAAAGLHVVLCSAGKFHTIQQEYILLRAISCDRKVIAGRRIRYSNSASFLPGKVDDPWVQRHQQVIAAAVERQILDLLFADEA